MHFHRGILYTHTIKKFSLLRQSFPLERMVLIIYGNCVCASIFHSEKNVEQLAANTKTSNGSKSQRHARESDGINKIIRIHTDQHRAVLNDIDEAIQTVLETGELPLFENGINIQSVCACVCLCVSVHIVMYVL